MLRAVCIYIIVMENIVKKHEVLQHAICTSDQERCTGCGTRCSYCDESMVIVRVDSACLSALQQSFPLLVYTLTHDGFVTVVKQKVQQKIEACTYRQKVAIEKVVSRSMCTLL